MHKRALTILAVVALAAVLAAVWLTDQRRAAPVAETGGLLAPNLSESVNAVTRVRLDDGAGGVTLERGESDWRVVERGGYPADLQQLRRKLLALSDARLLEKKTANPENYALLGVSDPGAAEEGSESDGDDEAVRLTLDGLPEPLSIILGKRNFRGSPSTYVRRADEAQSWLAGGDLEMAADPKEWLKRDLLDIASPRVRRVTLTHPDGTEFTIEKDTREAPDFELLDLPEGRELLSPSAGNSIAGALGNLRIDDVRPAAEVDIEGVTPVVGVFETFDGLRIHTRAWERDDKRHLTLSVQFDESLIPPPALAEKETNGDADAEQPASGEAVASQGGAAESGADSADEPEPTPDDGPEAADPAAVAESLSSAAEELAAAVEGWVFEIPSYKYNNLAKELEDLLKPLPTDDEDESE